MMQMFIGFVIIAAFLLMFFVVRIVVVSSVAHGVVHFGERWCTCYFMVHMVAYSGAHDVFGYLNLQRGSEPQSFLERV